jgi:hypothetical protein
LVVVRLTGLYPARKLRDRVGYPGHFNSFL